MLLSPASEGAIQLSIVSTASLSVLEVDGQSIVDGSGDGESATTSSAMRADEKTAAIEAEAGAPVGGLPGLEAATIITVGFPVDQSAISADTTNHIDSVASDLLSLESEPIEEVKVRVKAQFTTIPQEFRDMIYGFCLPDLETFELRCAPRNSRFPNSMARIAIMCKITVPAFRICRESRALAKKHYSLHAQILGPALSPQQIARGSLRSSKDINYATDRLVMAEAELTESHFAMDFQYIKYLIVICRNRDNLPAHSQALRILHMDRITRWPRLENIVLVPGPAAVTGSYAGCHEFLVRDKDYVADLDYGWVPTIPPTLPWDESWLADGLSIRYRVKQANGLNPQNNPRTSPLLQGGVMPEWTISRGHLR